MKMMVTGIVKASILNGRSSLPSVRTAFGRSRRNMFTDSVKVGVGKNNFNVGIIAVMFTGICTDKNIYTHMNRFLLIGKYLFLSVWLATALLSYDQER